MRNDPVVKGDLRDLVIAEKIAEYVRSIDIHQRIHMLFQLQKICMLVQKNFSVYHFMYSLLCFAFIHSCILA